MLATTAFHESGRRVLTRPARSSTRLPRRVAGVQRRRSGRGGVGKGRGVNPMRLVREPSYDTE